MAKKEMFKGFVLFFFLCVFFFFFFFFLFFAHGGHFVQPSRTFLAILVKGHKRNTSVKLLLNQDTGCGGDVFFFSLFFLL